MPDSPKFHQTKVSQAGESESTDRESTSPLKVLRYSTVNGLRSALLNRNILLTIPVFLVGIFRYTTLNFLIQYAYVRFGVRFSTGATFYTETAIVNIFLFLFLIPNLTSHIRIKYNTRPQIIDLFLVRSSVVLMCLGCLAIGFAQSKMVLPIGKNGY
jgi:hypothetical protein